MKSPVIKHTVYGRLERKTSISLEDAFWSSLKEIAHAQGTTPSAMVAEIDKTRQHGNLSSAVDRVRSKKWGPPRGKRQPQ